MSKYDIRPLQMHIIRILKAIDKVCQEHNLHYYLWAGTMLGAMRHKGFIPWDDDIDICMPRPDYAQLVKYSAEWLPKPYVLSCAETEDDYPGAFAKIIDESTTLIEREYYGKVSGIYMDVFPIDGVPDNRIQQRWVIARYSFYKKISYFLNRDPYKHGHGIRSWVPLLCRKFFSSKGVFERMKYLQTRYDYEKCSFVADYDDGFNGIIEKRILGKPKPVEFEGQTFMGVEHADVYLKKKYGNYMIVPDANHQRQHNFFYLNYNLPYKEYERLH